MMLSPLACLNAMMAVDTGVMGVADFGLLGLASGAFLVSALRFRSTSALDRALLLVLSALAVPLLAALAGFPFGRINPVGVAAVPVLAVMVLWLWVRASVLRGGSERPTSGVWPDLMMAAGLGLFVGAAVWLMRFGAMGTNLAEPIGAAGAAIMAIALKVRSDRLAAARRQPHSPEPMPEPAEMELKPSGKS
jgi:hypothetical protein